MPPTAASWNKWTRCFGACIRLTRRLRGRVMRELRDLRREGIRPEISHLERRRFGPIPVRRVDAIHPKYMSAAPHHADNKDKRRTLWRYLLPAGPASSDRSLFGIGLANIPRNR